MSGRRASPSSRGSLYLLRMDSAAADPPSSRPEHVVDQAGPEPEHVGPLELRRYVKEDGRGLIVHRRALDGERRT